MNSTVLGLVSFGSIAISTLAFSAAGQAQQVFATDVIVQGSSCVGVDCNNSETFGFDTFRLKENNLRIHFDDTSTSAAFPNNDWRITINDSANGGNSFFSIDDATANETLLRICPVADPDCGEINPFGVDDTQVDANTAASTSNASNISANTSAINTNSSNIAANTSAINSFSISSEAIQGNTEAIDENRAVIRLNSSAIARNSSEIANNSDNIQSLGSGIRNVGALTAALVALPEASRTGTPECGLGSGIYSGRVAAALGCAIRVNDRVTVNAGGSYAFAGSEDYGDGNLDPFMFKLGATFRFGKIAPTATDTDLEAVIAQQENDILALTEQLAAMSDRLAALEAQKP